MIKYLFPNLLTALNFLLGMCAILLCNSPEINLAAWLIVWCVLLDAVDGLIARKLQATSAFGTEFDSLADLTSFGIAPALLMIRASELTIANGQKMSIFGTTGVTMVTVAALFFSLTAAIRLARFNTENKSSGATWFSGFPSTLSGAVCGLLVLVAPKYNLLGTSSSTWICAAVLVLLGIGMISPLRIPKLRRRTNLWVNRFQNFNILAAFVLGLLRIWPEYLLGIAILYLVAGTISGASGKGDSGVT